MDAHVVRKRRRDEEEEEELEQAFFIIVSVATMLLGAMTWYHNNVSIDLEGSSSATRKNIHPSKSGEKEGMISSMKEVVESLKEFVEVIKKKMEIKEAQEVIHEVVNELDNIPNFNGALRHREIDWLTENPIKFEIIKALPLYEKEDHISSFMP
ncbi:hypothetical protein JHK85_040192 [Glycine max]|nr:hypothetical protein JHK86_039615 [Glycine max]KAG4965217.1 hypothetical protein JHK85_040192 [Glycine max]KAH1093990.1 hypothetical protein GYH30_039639 [Glycine max]